MSFNINNISHNTRYIILSLLLISGAVAVFYAYAPIQAAITSRLSGGGGLENGLIGYWPFDNIDTNGTTSRDKSGNGFNGTMGSLLSIVDDGVIGQSMNDVGDTTSSTNADGFVVSHNATLLPTAGLSFSLWIKSTDSTACWISKHGSDENGTCFNNQHIQFGIFSGTLEMSVHNTTPTNFLTQDSNASARLLDGNWHHVVVTVGTDLPMKFYYDGALAKTGGTFTGTLRQSPTSNLTFGAGGLYGFSGKMDEVRYYNRALSADEVKRLYNLRPALQAKPALSQDLVGHWSFDEDAGTTVPDHSGQGNTGTATGGPAGTTGQLGRALSFDGSDDYVSVADANSLDQTTAMTVAFWAKPNSESGTDALVLKWNESSSQQSWAVQVFDGGSSILVHTPTSNSDDSTSGTYNLSASEWQAGSWKHVAFIFDGAGSGNAGRLKLYLDGTQVSLTSFSGTVPSSLNTSTANLEIGGFSTVAGRYFDGTIDDVRMYSRTLSADEIKRLYNVRPATVNASPTSKLTSGLVGYWTFDGSDITGTPGNTLTALDRSGNGYSMASSGFSPSAVDPALASGKFGQAAVFNGLNAGSGAAGFLVTATAIPTTNGSVCAWIYPYAYPSSVDTGRANIFAAWAGGSNATIFRIHSNGTIHGSDDTGTTDFGSTAAAPLNTWTHTCMTWDGSTGRIYVNATQDGSGGDGTQASGRTSWRVGRPFDTSDSFNGRIDDVRIYNRALSASEVSQLYNLGR